MKFKHLPIIAIVALMVTACETQPQQSEQEAPAAKLSDKYAKVTLTTDVSHLSDNEKQMLPLLFKAADIMNDIFWVENFGEKDSLMARISDPDMQLYADINYGPWDGINNEIFLPTTVSNNVP